MEAKDRIKTRNEISFYARTQKTRRLEKDIKSIIIGRIAIEKT